MFLRQLDVTTSFYHLCMLFSNLTTFKSTIIFSAPLYVHCRDVRIQKFLVRARPQLLIKDILDLRPKCLLCIKNNVPLNSASQLCMITGMTHETTRASHLIEPV